MNPPASAFTLEQAADTAVLAARECQAALDRACRRLDVQQCTMDFAASRLDLIGSRGVLSTDAILIGAVDDEGEVWHWAWRDLPWLGAQSPERCAPVRRYGAEVGIAELVAPELPSTPDLVDNLILAAQSVIPGRSLLSFRAFPQGEAYFLLDAPDLRLAAPGIVQVSQLLSEALRDDVMSNHRLALAGYQRRRGIVVSKDAHGEWIRWHLIGGDLVITFDDRHRIAKLNGTGSTIPTAPEGGSDPGRGLHAERIILKSLQPPSGASE
jgi:hypothetical protein